MRVKQQKDAALASRGLGRLRHRGTSWILFCKLQQRFSFSAACSQGFGIFLISWLVKTWYHGSRSKAEGVFNSGCSLSIPLQYVTARNRIGKKPGIWRHMFLRCQCGCKSARRMTDEEKDQRVQQMRVCSLKLTLKPVSLCWFLRACCSQRCGDVAKTAQIWGWCQEAWEAKVRLEWLEGIALYQQCVKHRFKMV